jgi:Cys-tRNA(Pro) deacylase
VATTWPEPVERVSSFLRDAGAEARIEEFGEEAQTAAAAAEAVGCELGQIVKSLVLVCDGHSVVALVPGDRRGDLKKIAQASGAAKARIASADEVVRATGFDPGGVAPFPLPRVESVLLDRSLLRHTVVWAGAGSERHVVGLAPAELLRLAQARPVDVIQDHPYDFAGDSAPDPPEPKER